MTHQISNDDITYLAQLSAIALDDDQVASIRVHIENILGYVEQLGELDTSGVEPTYQVTGLENVLRADQVEESSVSSTELVAAAAESLNQQFKVPKVL
jgi:aspartyl-tRNA(Asn)/glutamyl-tRNA(Gln) amidotransferase subunit C